MRLLLLAALGCLAGCPAETDDDDSAAGPARVRVETRLGAFTIRLHADEAPATAANFLAYVDAGFYDGRDGLGATVFHRVIPDFVVQGGGVTEAGAEKATGEPVPNEAASSGLSNVRGTVAMARTSDPDSATAQWFVNVVDNLFLDPGGSTDAGYAVFGEVEDMDAVDAVAAERTGADDAPLAAVVITSAARAD